MFAFKRHAPLGRHSHPHFEGLFLVQGACLVRTWGRGIGVREEQLNAPVMFMFYPNEEHTITCSEDAILIDFLPLATNEEPHNTPAANI